MRAGTDVSTFGGSIAPSTNPAPLFCVSRGLGGLSPGCSGCRRSRCTWRGSGGCTRGGAGRRSAAARGATSAPCPPRSGTCKGSLRCGRDAPLQEPLLPGPEAVARKIQPPSSTKCWEPAPGSSPGGPYLPEWMERFCPTYFISWGGPCSHTHCTAHASAALASRSSHTWRGGKERAAGIWAARGRQVGKPTPCVWRGGSEPLQLPPKPGLHVSLEKSCGKGANCSGDEPQPCPGEGFWKAGI